MSPFVSSAEASKRPTHHQFISGVGYIAHAGPPDLPPGANGTKNCLPKKGSVSGSRHLLQPPGNHKPIEMLWLAADQAWMHPVPGRGNRLAWTADHLSKAGWEYLRPAKR